jgi:hypothetical protein
MANPGMPGRNETLHQKCVMSEHETAGRVLAKGAGLLAIHLVAVLAGVVMMIAGLGMGVSIVLLPLGVPLGLFGLLFFICGMFGWTDGEQVPVQPPSPQ